VVGGLERGGAGDRRRVIGHPAQDDALVTSLTVSSAAGSIRRSA
jgi:hypothetical protein